MDLTMVCRRTISAWVLTVLVGTLLLGALETSPAHARKASQTLVADKNEKAVLKACERQICGIVVGRKPAGPNLACKLSKTWSKKSLQKGGKKSKVSWLFGAARCDLDISMNRAIILGALTSRKFTLKFPQQLVNCRVERKNKIHPVTIRAEPKITFKNGQVKKVWLKVRKVHGPSDIKGLIWTVARLEDSLGIFHRPMVKQINKFLHKKCAKVVRAKAAN